MPRTILLKNLPGRLKNIERRLKNVYVRTAYGIPKEYADNIKTNFKLQGYLA